MGKDPSKTCLDFCPEYKIVACSNFLCMLNSSAEDSPEVFYENNTKIFLNSFQQFIFWTNINSQQKLSITVQRGTVYGGHLTVENSFRIAFKRSKSGQITKPSL